MKANLNRAYDLGCLSILLQQDKDLDVRNLGLKLMAAADRKQKQVTQAFSAGRVDTAVALSRRLAKNAEKTGTSRGKRTRPR